MSAAVEAARRIVAEATGHSAGEISGNSDMFSLPGWDSIAHMKVILAAEERLGTALEPQVIVNLTGMRDLVRLFET